MFVEVCDIGSEEAEIGRVARKFINIYLRAIVLLSAWRENFAESQLSSRTLGYSSNIGFNHGCVRNIWSCSRRSTTP